ncbi:hypothetical protein E4U21_004521 [Claviceps maximensis]|nr:hypothetical protein E4U21_004521 [Claviceps maximensis]
MSSSPALKPPAHLRELVKTAFAKALAGEHLYHFATQVTLVNVGAIQFQLRFSPALANKPKPKPKPSPQKAESDVPAEKSTAFNPFAHPPPSLLIADVGPSHYLVLNKFAVVPEHFILATRGFKPQNHVLESADLEATVSCLEAYAPLRQRQQQQQKQKHDGRADSDEDDDDDGLFAFFNSGEHSGASQPHRHVQFLPVEQMRRGLEHQPGECLGSQGGKASRWSPLAGQGRVMEKEMPFVVFSEELRPGMLASDVYAAYLRLYREGCQAVRRATKGQREGGHHAGDGHENGDHVPGEGPALISYNLAMTRKRMVLCPRLAEGGPVLDSEGHEVGRLALNGTVLAGTALVKNEVEWEALRKRPSGLADVLGGIGIPRSLIG